MLHSLALQEFSFQISHKDFKYWKIYPTSEILKEAETRCLYPPRFQVKCKQTDPSKPLYISLELSRKTKNADTESIGEFTLIKEGMYI